MSNLEIMPPDNHNEAYKGLLMDQKTIDSLTIRSDEPAANDNLAAANDNLEVALGDLGTFMEIADKIGGFNEKDLKTMKENLLNNKKLQAKTGYNDEQFKKSVADWVDVVSHQINTFMTAIFIARAASNPEQALKKAFKNPGTVKSMLNTLRKTAELRIAFSEKQRLPPEEERTRMEKVASVALDFIKPIDQINIQFAKAFIKVMDKLGINDGAEIDPKFFNPNRWSEPEILIAQALFGEMLKIKSVNIVKTHITAIGKEEHDKEMDVVKDAA